MKSFIEEFYYGNIEPQGRSRKQSPTVKKEFDLLSKNEELLTQVMRYIVLIPHASAIAYNLLINAPISSAISYGIELIVTVVAIIKFGLQNKNKIPQKQ